MNIIAAFLWDSSEKSISTMIIDSDYKESCKPIFKKLDSENFSTFKNEARKIIRQFFNEIKNVQTGHDNSNVKIEYKIVSHATPAYPLRNKIHSPSDRTNFVKKTFCDLFKEGARNNESLKLAEYQYRKKLQKPELTKFKNKLH